jgi:putative endonuclease
LKKEHDWQVYIIQTESGKLYTGIARDRLKRFEEHLSSKKGAKFFRIEKPKKIVYWEQHKNRSEASKRERKIKSLSRQQKLQLITSKPSRPLRN